jgi:putative transposase
LRFEFILAEKANFPITILCRVLEVSRSGYYAWLRRPLCPRRVEDEQISVEIQKVHEQSVKRYGSPRIHKALRRKGRRVSRKRVARLMRQKGIYGRKKRKFKHTTDSNHQYQIAPNVLDRNFQTERPDQVWVGDITYVWTLEGWLYLAVLIDLCTHQVVGWSMSANIDRFLALDAFDMAVARRSPTPGLIHHTDRGSQYACPDYQLALKVNGFQPSMSRKGNCWDNAVAESFFGAIKEELIYNVVFTTRDAARQAIFEYIEVFYNRQRLHSSIGYMSPIEFELANFRAIAA